MDVMKGSGSVVERLLSKQEVMGSTPLSGSILFKLVIISKEILVIHFQISQGITRYLLYQFQSTNF